MQVTSRHHLRSDAVNELESSIEAALGASPEGDTYERVTFENTDVEVVLVDGDPLVTYFDGEPFPTVKGANELEPEHRRVVVDAGAVSFVSDGADVMRPGVTEADETIAAGDLVVIVEESHGKALAIGRSRVDGDELLGNEGKVIDSLHHVGDELYGFSG